MQKLIMPFKSSMMLCGYKSDKYGAYWGYPHYGVDISTIQGGAGSDTTLYASGEGTVINCGWDNSAGNLIIIRYNQCYNHHTKAIADLIVRYFHLDRIDVKVGQYVKAGEAIGTEGNTKTGDYHLHVELDTDVDYPAYSPQVSSYDDSKSKSQGNILRKGIDTTVNPSFVFHIDGSWQRVVKPTYNPAWLNAEDFVIPTLN